MTMACLGLIVPVVLNIMSNVATGSAFCPAKCTCERLPHQEGLNVNCAEKGLTDIPSNLTQDTIYLDLSRNIIQKIPAHAFAGLYKLAVLHLEDNVIRDIEPYAFQGMTSFEQVNLRHNSLSVIRENAFTDMSGAAGVCGTGLRHCSLDLRGNDLNFVEPHAFAWMHHLDVHIGGGNHELSVSSYAFYGSGDFTRIEIGDVPTLDLHPRAFTNTEHVSVLRLHDTTIPHLQEYHLQGLTQVERILFDKIEFRNIESSAFSAVSYALGDWKTKHRGEEGFYNFDNFNSISNDLKDISRLAQCGGGVTFTECIIPHFPPDLFTDTNLARVNVMKSQVASIEAHAFRGMVCLKRLTLHQNKIDDLQPHALGHIRHAHQVALLHNTLDVFPAECFKESKNIHTLIISIPKDLNVLFMPHSFSGLHSVKDVRLNGESGASLTLQPNALNNLVGVNKIVINNLNIENLGENSLHGLATIWSLRLQRCNITNIHRQAFGVSQTTGIEHVHLGSINCKSCENSDIMRAFKRMFQKFSVTCNGGGNYMSFQRHCNDITNSASVTSTSSILLISVLMLVWIS